MDKTEGIRQIMVGEINAQVASNDEDEERKRLEKDFSQVWNTEELRASFSVEGFMAPFVVVRRLSDNKKGTLMFQHHPRFYFSFTEM